MKIKYLKDIICPICTNQSDMKIIRTFQDRQFISCPHCHVDFFYPLLNEQEISNIYSKQYYLNWGDIENIRKIKSETFSRYIEKLQHFKNGKNILDVGTAYGLLLEQAKKKGLEPYGVDISSYATDIARKNVGTDKIFTGTIKDVPFKENYFDFITICDVLEHVQSPISTLKKANMLLKKDGCLLLVTPYSKALGAHIQNMNINKYQLEHVFRFKKETILKMCDITNFDVAYCEQVWKTMNISYMASLLNAYSLFPITQILNLLNKIKFINKINFKIKLGNIMFILKKKQS